MNLFVISLLAVASMSLLPSQVDGGAPSTDVKAQAAVAAAAAAVAPATGEIWQEDDREVLIRNVRGAKNNKDAQTGSASGKKGGKNRKNGGHNKQKEPTVGQQQQPHGRQQQQQHKKPKQNPNKTPIDENNRSCRYAKSQWSECDAKTNQRTRTLTLKRGEAGCVQTRTIQKKCKKACRYEKGSWSECVGGKMTRIDKLRTNNSEANGAPAQVCEATRSVQKNCNAGKKAERKQKDKGGRKGGRA